MTLARCVHQTPTSLTGDLSALQCTLWLAADGTPHDGQHRATRTVKGVGKVIYRWRAGKKRSRPRQPPVIDLPFPGSEVLNPRMADRHLLTPRRGME